LKRIELISRRVDERPGPRKERLGASMNVTSSSIGFLFLGILAATVLGAAEPAPPGPWVLVVQAGRNPRKDTPVRVEVPGDRLGEPLRAALGDGPKPVLLRELRDGSSVGEPIVAQVERVPDATGGKVRLTWILAGETPADAERKFRPESGRPGAAAGPIPGETSAPRRPGSRPPRSRSIGPSRRRHPAPAPPAR